MTKAKIVERLLEEKHITAEEAVVLLTEIKEIRDNPYIERPFVPITVDNTNDMVPYGEICSCNPKNGGGGICGCAMGNQMVPRNGYNKYGNWTTNISGNTNNPNLSTDCACGGNCKC